MKERKQYIDMGAGIMVLWIIFGHANSVVYFTAPDYQVNYPSFLFFAILFPSSFMIADSFLYRLIVMSFFPARQELLLCRM